MGYKKKTAFILLILLLFISFSSSLIKAESMQIDEINFKEADIKDVLRAVANIFDKNIIIDNSVNKKITISLDNVNFTEALKLITDSSGLSYRFDGNTVFIASPQRIEQLYEKKMMKIVNLKYMELDEAEKLLKNIFNQLQIARVTNNKQLILKGLNKDVEKALDLIKKLDKPDKNDVEKVVESGFKIISLYQENLGMIKRSITAIYPELTIVENKDTGKMVLEGKLSDIEKAMDIINRLDVKPVKESSTDSNTESLAADMEKELISDEQTKEREENEEKKITVKIKDKIISDYIPLEDASKILTDNYPELTITKNPSFRELIISGAETEVKKAVNFMGKIDRPQRQVMIEVRVEEISRSSTVELGIKGTDSEESSGFPRVKFVKESDGRSIDAVEMQWPDVLDYLESKGKAETLANPHLITLNGKNGKMLIGDRIPVKTVNDDGTESIKYIEAGITLDFTPWISQDDLIRLDVSPTVSSIGEDLYDGYPVIKTREVSTTLNLKDGETFAVGGLIQEDNKVSNDKVPYLSEIPILGELFKRRDNKQSKTELVIFITPRIVDSYDNMNEKIEYEFFDQSKLHQEQSKDNPK